MTSSTSASGEFGGSAPPRAELIRQLEAIEQQERLWIRQQVLENGRIDILATEVLGYEIAKHHFEMLQQQELSDWLLTLLFRGGGKTTVLTVVRTIYELLRNPNIRILIASKSLGNAQSMLSEVKAHFEENDRFREVFGDLVGRKKWDDTEISVATRTKWTKEANVTCVGVEGSVVSKHYDIILADDLVDEENSRTPAQRSKVETFFHKTLIPTLEPDIGRLWIQGTRYHPKDLYGHLLEVELGDEENSLGRRKAHIVPALQGDEEEGWRSAWPEKFSVEFLLDRRKKRRIDFETQYQQNAEMFSGGGYVDFDQCQRFETLPEKQLPAYAGVDLAPGEERVRSKNSKKKPDEFAVVVAKLDKETGNIYVYRAAHGRWNFSKQRQYVKWMHRDDESIVRTAMESISYQAVLMGELKRDDPMLPLVPVKPRVDKATRLDRVTPLFESGQIFFGPGCDDLIIQLVAFPNGDYDDLVDAFLWMITAIKKRARKKRNTEFGVP